MTDDHTPQTHLDAVIRALAGPQAAPRHDQRRATAALVDERRRVLVVQATGWGKSAVYWAATAAHRAAGAGPTLVISPLLALMRDQVAAAERAGLEAATVNSTNVEESGPRSKNASTPTVDVLLISPERLANPRFAAKLGPLVGRCGLVVIDEAHCISDWGFDFRPDYQRLSKVLVGLAPDTPILATTATANERVTADVAAQLGPDTLVLRGTLARASLRLHTVGHLGALDRYAWVADALEQLGGSGIVYVLTVAETDRLADFLRSEGVEAEAYSGSLDAVSRERVEERLKSNRVKAVVATSALGMGFDKADLGFVVHVGSPASPVAYYQQVGRAGRGIDDAVAVLLPSAGDERIWAYFATASIPDPAHADAVLALLDGRGSATVPALEAETGIRRTRLEALLKVLAVDGAVERRDGGWASTGQGWSYDEAKYDALLAVRTREAGLMRSYAAGAGCLMEFLQQALDDPDPGPCGQCSVCTGTLPHPGARPSRERASAVRRFLRGRDVVIEPRKMWPPGTPGRKGRIKGPIGEGRALAFADDPAWGEALADLDGRDGPVGDELGAGLDSLVDRWASEWPARPAVVVPMPSRSRPVRVAELAERVAARLGAEVVAALDAVGPTPPSGVASGAPRRRVLDAVAPRGPALDGPVVLVDDTYRTGWTMTVAATVLGDLGATDVRPLVIHQLPG
ncbi:MAG: DEAD/DEAH box helicase [Acidimicrobiia bacterium]|nr:DEAD/DEAH box helicase [Acidimicrobiia bacterium]